MTAIAAVLVLVSLSVIVTRVGAAAFIATGVSADLAHFQARSAFTGVGYTTNEAEAIVGHPVRRRIILTLMLLGNAGIVSVIASLVLGFAGATRAESLVRLGTLAVGLGGLWFLTSTERFNRTVTRLIGRLLERWTDLEVRDYVELLGVSGRYGVRELAVGHGDWLEGRTLRELDLPAEGVLILGIRRAGGEFLGAPTADTEISDGDTVILYGRADDLDALDARPAGPHGDADHGRAVEKQRHEQAAEQARDEQSRAQQRAAEAARKGRDADAAQAAARAERERQRAEHREERAEEAARRRDG